MYQNCRLIFYIRLCFCHSTALSRSCDLRLHNLRPLNFASKLSIDTALDAILSSAKQQPSQATLCCTHGFIRHLHALNGICLRVTCHLPAKARENQCLCKFSFISFPIFLSKSLHIPTTLSYVQHLLALFLLLRCLRHIFISVLLIFLRLFSYRSSFVFLTRVYTRNICMKCVKIERI